MNDYEQKYYDLIFENKRLKKEKEQLENEIEIYKSFLKKQNLKKTLIQLIKNYKTEDKQWIKKN